MESLRTNVTLVRRRLRSPALRVEMLTLGRRTRTEVAILHLIGVANPRLHREVRRRLRRIDVDGILDSSYLSEQIADSPLSPFPTTRGTERPDTVVAHLLEGKVAILADGSPFALVAPCVFWEFLQPAEDAYEGYLVATFLRGVRLLATGVAVFSTPFYVATATFHPEMLPTVLTLRIAATVEKTPFPMALAVLLMELLFEVLREAAARMPKAIGGAISIVGGIVLGEMAVRANLVSPTTVMLVSGAGIASFAVPATGGTVSLRLLRFPLLALAAALGHFGLLAGALAILIHLLVLRSFGVPYLSPVVPAAPRDWRDVPLRLPRRWLTRRPGYPRPVDPVRQRLPTSPVRRIEGVPRVRASRQA